MNKGNMKVLTNVIGAVESGGQKYGKQRYDAYTDPYTNSPNEHTVTLGWAQNYGNKARELINRILDENKNLLPGDLKSVLDKDWVAIRWKPTASQKQMLISLINSDTGKQVQDEMFAEDMEKFIADCAREYTSDIKAQMMYCEIRHLGGKAPTDRIFGRLNGDYGLDSILASLAKDQRDKSNDNQVGDAIYWSRHVKCRQFIEQYAEDEKEVRKMTKAEKAIQWAEGIARDDSHGYSQYNRDGNPDYDCSSLVLTAYEKAGVPVKSVAGCSYTGNMYKMKNVGFKDVTSKVNIKTGAGLKRGDILWRDGHTALYSGNMLETEAACDENGDIVGHIPGDQTGREILIQPYNPNWTKVYRYEEDEWLEKGDSGDAVQEMQVMLISLGYKCEAGGATGKFNSGTEKAVKKFQKDYQLTVDGKCGKNTGAKLKSVYKSKITSKWKCTGTATLIVTSANIRGTASGKTKSNIIGKVTKGQRFEVDGYKKGPWVHVKHSDVGIGYITQRYMKYDNSKDTDEDKKDTWKATGTATCKNNGVYVRSTPSSASTKNVIGSLNRGQRFEVDGKKSGNWVHVKIAGIGQAWIHKAYVQYD